MEITFHGIVPVPSGHLPTTPQGKQRHMNTENCNSKLDTSHLASARPAIATGAASSRANQLFTNHQH